MKTVKFAALALIFVLLATSFTGGENLKDMSVAEGMGLDYSDNSVSVTVQTLNLAKGGNGADALSGNITMNTTGEGENISSAVQNISESLSKKLFFGQNRILVIGMEMAQDHLHKSFDYLLRSTDSRPDVAVCIAQDKAADILNSTQNDALVPAQAIASLLEEGEENGFGVYVMASEMLNLYTDKTSDIYLPILSANDKSVSVSGIALFNGEKFVGILPNADIMGFLFLKDEIESGSFVFDTEDYGKTSVGIISSSTKTSSVLKDGKVHFKVEIKASLMLNEIESGITESLTKQDIEALTKACEKEIARKCTDSFNFCTRSSSDCLRIGENLSRNSNSDYKSVLDNWDEYLKNSVIDIKCECVFKKINENSSGN